MSSTAASNDKAATTISRISLLISITLPVAWLLVGLFLAMRRIQGRMNDPLSLGAIVLTASVMALLSMWGRQLLERTWVGNPRVPRLIYYSLLVVSLFALAVPGTGAVGVTLFCLVVLTPELVSWFGNGFESQPVPETRDPPITTEPLTQVNLADETTSMEESAESPSALDADSIVTQRLTRSISPNGDETIAGELRAEFAANTGSSRLHVAFCPPLATVPEVFVEQVDGPECSIRVAKAQVNGVRIDVLAAEPFTQEAFVLLEMYAVCTH